MKRIVYLLVLSSIVYVPAQSQDAPSHEAPTLQVGLGGLNFQKGTLDKELILAIIAEKQQEVKTQLIKNMLLSKLDMGGGAFYTYVDNVITTLLSKKDIEITNRALLESTINIVFTYAFVDYYVRTANTEEMADVNKLAMSMGWVLPASRKNVTPPRNLQDFNDARFTNYTTANSEFKANRSYSNQSNTMTQFMGMMIDIGAEVTRNNEFLRHRGLLQTPYNAGYESLNTYLSLPNCDDVKDITFLKKYLTYQKELDEIFSNSTLSYEALYTKIEQKRSEFQGSSYDESAKCFADRVYASMQNRMNEILRYVGLVYYLRDLSEMSKETLGDLTKDEIKEVLFRTVSDQDKDELIDYAVLRIKAVISENPGEDAKKVLSEALQMLSRLRRSDLSEPALNNNSQLLFYLKSYILPVLTELIYKAPSSIDLAEVLEDLAAVMARELFDELGNEHSVITENQKTAFLNLLSRLYEFDKPETISAYMNILPEIGAIFPNSNVQQSINMISSFLKQYTTFGEEENQEYLNIDVEGLLVRLKEIKLNKFRPLEFHFTVGSNTLMFDNEVVMDPNNTFNSTTVVGEKIGLKLKIVDWDYLRTFNKGETFKYYGKYYTRTSPPAKPVLSNVHVLAYGSGLLYNLANTSSEDEFNAPFFGLNLGFTFFNNLDFSVGRGFPLFDDKSFKENFESPFWSFGFDIQFGEYLTRLNEKRKNQRQNKKVEKYLSEKNSKTDS